MFLMKAMIGAFTRGVLLPNALNLAPSSPVFGQPSLVSVIPGAYSNTTPGTVNFPVPNYTTMTITLRGAGGGGSSDVVSTAATDGGSTQFLLATGTLPPGTTGVTLGASTIANGGLKGVGPVPADQGGSGGTVTVGGGGAGGAGKIGSATSASASYTAPGSYTFSVPVYTSMTVAVSAGGGGSSSPDNTNGGTAGLNSSFSSGGTFLLATGGGPGTPSGPGGDGSGSGGTVSGVGGAGGTNGAQPGGNGGRVTRTYSPGELSGSQSVQVGGGGLDGSNTPGGGGDSRGFEVADEVEWPPPDEVTPLAAAEDGSVLISWTFTPPHPASYYNASAGGRVTKTWNITDVGAPPAGTIIGIVIGAGGTPANTPLGPATAGTPGRIDITWS